MRKLNTSKQLLSCALVLMLGSSALPQASDETVHDVVLITDKQELPEDWKALLDLVGTEEFKKQAAKKPSLVYLSDAGIGYLFDKKALGIDKRLELGKVAGSLLQLLAQGQSIANVKLSNMPANLADNIRKRFKFHSAVGLDGIDGADFDVTVSASMTMYFEKDGKTVKMNHRFPYTRPDAEVTLKPRENLLKNTPTDQGVLSRSTISKNLVVHYSNPLRTSSDLMEYSSKAFLEAAEYILAIAEANDAIIDNLWSEMLEQQDGIDEGISKTDSFQDLPKSVKQILEDTISSSYEKMGFSSREEAAEFLRFASIRHADRKLGFSVGYQVEGKENSSQLTMNLVLDHR